MEDEKERGNVGNGMHGFSYKARLQINLDSDRVKFNGGLIVYIYSTNVASS